METDDIKTQVDKIKNLVGEGKYKGLENFTEEELEKIYHAIAEGGLLDTIGVSGTCELLCDIAYKACKDKAETEGERALCMVERRVCKAIACKKS